MSSLMANYQSHSASSGSSVKVKEERHDEAEIAEMAAKMKEDQKTAAAKSALQQQQQQVVRQLQSPSVNQTNILNFLQRKPAATTASVVSNGAENGSSLNDSQEDAKPADEESIKGHFGWESFSGGKIHIPYIIRQVHGELIISFFVSWIDGDYYCICDAILAAYFWFTIIIALNLRLADNLHT